MPTHLRPLAAVALAIGAVLANASLTALPAQADELDIRPATPNTAPAPPAATDQFIVGIKGRPGIASEAAATSEAARQAAATLGIAARNIKATATGAQVVKTDRPLPGAQAEAFLTALRANPAVAYAEPDIIMQAAAAAPNDPGYDLQWGLWEEPAGLRIPGAWDVNRGEGAVVAVVDSGITSHSDLNPRVLPGYDMMSDASWARDGSGRDANPQDEGDWVTTDQCGLGTPEEISSWHGTHVAGIIAAAGNNNNGIIGVAPEARILPVRAIGACGGYSSDIADSVIWAAGGQVSGVPANPNRARVINLSVGGLAPCSITQQNAINFAYNAGAAVVVAAGNFNRSAADMSPANCQNVITVAAAGRNGARAPYSNYGTPIDVTAPGGDVTHNYNSGVLSTSNSGSTTPEEEAYEYLQGTSMSAPHVAGVAALMMSEIGSTYTPDMVEKRLKATARPMAVACNEGCGAGLVDASKALAFAPSDLPANTVSPAAVVFTDKDGTAQDTFTVPASQGVEYLRDGSVLAPGVYPGSGAVTISARALPGYTLVQGAPSSWSHTFAATLAPVAGSLIPVPPFRALDTRGGAPVPPDSAVSFQVAGQGGIPDKVSAVVFNMTVAEAQSFGFVTAYASGAARPNASNVNFTTGQIVANAATVPVGADGKVTLFNRSAGATHLLADVSGYYLPGVPTAAGAFQPITPTRFLDTRSTAPVPADSTVGFQVAGVNGVPASVSAVVLNLTVAEARSFGFITAYPSGAERPNASNINFRTGQIIPNSVTVPVGADGKVTLFNRSSGATHLLADVSGYYLSGTPKAAGTFQPMVPTRFLDTRQGYPVGADNLTAFQVTGEHGIPAGASAIVFNLTVAEANSFGFITAYPTSGSRPNVSSVNFNAGQIVPNSVTVPVGMYGKVTLFNRSSAANHLVADVAGYFLPG